MIPGVVVSIVTFPGVVVHEIAHQFFCRLSRVAVLEVCYFRFGNPSGYVVHEHPPKTSQHILIGIGPFLLNSIVGGLIALPAAIPALQFDAGTPIDYFLIWLGVTSAMHSFPSTGDAKALWQAVWGKKTQWLTRLLVSPLVVIIYLGAIGSVLWLDLAYGAGVAMLFPKVLVSALA